MIKKINQLVEKFFKDGVSEAGKARIIANIEKANSPDYKWQVACHDVAINVIDDMLNDPFWASVIMEAKENGAF